MSGPRRVIIAGAGGRDFHNFNTVFRDDPDSVVVAFTATQIPGIDDRVYPSSLAGPRYPHGIPIRPEARLGQLIAELGAEEVVLSYSDLAHDSVMHLGSLVLAAGASYRLLSPTSTWLRSRLPVLAVCGVRTGVGKSQVSRYLAELLRGAGLRVALVRHPMPYGNLEAMRSQRFATLADIDAAGATIEEREEYEEPVRRGITVYAGVDYAEVLARAESEADVILWDGGNNDASFFEPDLLVTVADALRPGHELAYHPGELNLRMADVVVVNKADAAPAGQAERIVDNVRTVNPGAPVVRLGSPVRLDGDPDLAGMRVLVVEDGPTLTHGGMAEGAGAAAARRAGAELVDPRPHAVGSVAAALAAFDHLGPVLPALGYSPAQIGDLEETMRAVPCDAVVTATPCDLSHLVKVDRPMWRARYDVEEIDRPSLAEVVAPTFSRWAAGGNRNPGAGVDPDGFRRRIQEEVG